jgi:hypothetical protein
MMRLVGLAGDELCDYILRLHIYFWMIRYVGFMMLRYWARSSKRRIDIQCSTVEDTN